MTPPAQRRRERLLELSRALITAQKPIRVLDAIAWPGRVRERFLSRKRPTLPKVEYAPLKFDAEAHDALLAEVEASCDRGDPIQVILRDTASQYRQVLEMLRGRGTPVFLERSRLLYGSAADPFVGGTTTNLDLAEHLHALLDAEGPSPGPAARPMSAEAACRELRRRFGRRFGKGVVSVEVSGRITADAAAGSSRLRLRRGAHFDDDRLGYLEQHEGYVHIATTLNGASQPVLPIFGKAAPRVVKYNEGLAVFAEWASGALTMSRLEQLSERVILVQIAESGGDFLDVYRHLIEHGVRREDAYERAHRVFRGGLPSGEVFFTKDTAYLDHFVRAFNLFRAAADRGLLASMRLLFAGKFAFEDLPTLVEARREGLLEPAAYLPPWLERPAWLRAHLSLSLFFNRMSAGAISDHYRDLLDQCHLDEPV